MLPQSFGCEERVTPPPARAGSCAFFAPTPTPTLHARTHPHSGVWLALLGLLREASLTSPALFSASTHSHRPGLLPCVCAFCLAWPLWDASFSCPEGCCGMRRVAASTPARPVRVKRAREVGVFVTHHHVTSAAGSCQEGLLRCAGRAARCAHCRHQEGVPQGGAASVLLGWRSLMLLRSWP